jgi:glycosyltransferase involved in cell wall biosynthesis
MNLTIIIPAHNEEKNIRNLLMKLQGVSIKPFEIIIIDDYSSDGTYEAVKGILRECPGLVLAINQYEKGFANALRTGFDLAANEVVIPVMADLCDEIDIIAKMYNEIIRGYDVVCASRYMKGGRREKGDFFKTFFSVCFNKLVRFITKIPCSDTSNAFKAYRKNILRDMDLKSKSFEISAEILLNAYFSKYKITELPTVYKKRTCGKSHFVLIRDGMRFLRMLLPIIFKSFVSKL